MTLTQIPNAPLAARRWVPRRLSRTELFGALYILGCANGFLGRMIQSLSFDNWMEAVSSIDINVVVLFACFAGIASIMVENREDQIQGMDLFVAPVFLVLVSLPIFPLSWLAITGLSLYILLFTKQLPERRRGAIILLALAVPMLWSRLFFQFFAEPVLKIDASIAAWLLGTERVGNVFRFADGSGYVLVAPACSSLANMSLAFLTWISITQWAKHDWSPQDILWSSLACMSVLAVNITRIAIMGLSPWHYKLLHQTPLGDAAGNTVMLLLAVGFSILGARREIFSRS